MAQAKKAPTKKITPPKAAAPAPSSSSSGKKVLIVVLVIVLALGLLSALGGFLIYRSLKNAVNDENIDQLNQAVEELQSYPEAFTNAGLPEYPDAEVISFGDTVEEGITIYLTTSDTQSEIASFYDTKLQAAGWSAQPGDSQLDGGLYFKTYTKGNQQIALTIQEDPSTGQSSVSFNWELQ